MPRSSNPGNIKTGPGKATPSQTDNFVLVGAGMVGVPPNIGQPGFIPPGGVVPESGYPMPPAAGIESSSSVLLTHINDPHDAHPAIAISIDGHPPLIFSNNVEGAIDELMGAIAAEPPQLGQWLPHMSSVFSGFPDWGLLRLGDGYPSHEAPPGSTFYDTYPLYWLPPTPTTDNEFTSLQTEDQAGMDPQTDSIWCHSAGSLGVDGDASWVSAAYSYPTGEVIRTRINRYADPPPWPDANSPVFSLSGCLYPADKGVLALLHFPPETSMGFLDQDLEDRCWAALLLGQGLYSQDGCSVSPADTTECDGEPGGIFSLGTNADGEYDPFEYPGRATGQYDLVEIHRGVSDIDGSALPAPWAGGSPRVLNAEVPGAGQVRLGTVPEAGEADPTGYGIPILGATEHAYDPVPPVDADFVNPVRTLGCAVVRDENFFRYRLPYLEDYGQEQGLKYTPRGENVLNTREVARYFRVAEPFNVDTERMTLVGADYYLNNGGAYSGFDADYWTWQIARYKQLFVMKDLISAGAEIGSLLLVHFKTERDFEKCVRDGIMPWDAVDGYDVYGVTASVDPQDGVPDTYADLVNRNITGDVAPDYGYGADPYHTIRENMFCGDFTTTPSFDSGQWMYSRHPAVVNLAYTYISGIAYMIPRDPATNLENFQLERLTATFQDAWVDGYRTDALSLTPGTPATPPAVLSSQYPTCVTLGHFAYSDDPTYTSPVGFTDHYGRQRIEFPYTYLGANAGGPFTETNGPQNADDLTFNVLPYGEVTFGGDSETPSFSTNAAPRVFIRRPLTTPQVQPVTADGQGEKLLLGVGTPTDNVLFHSTGFYESAPGVGTGGIFGNFLTGGQAYLFLLTAGKDTEERFLDEVYRFQASLPIGLSPIEMDALTGPGMGAWAGGPITVPVQIGNTDYIGPDAVLWAGASWVQAAGGAIHEGPLPAGELQVGGLPDRNPPVLNWVKSPFPSSGILLYPKTDYTMGFRPNAGELFGGDTQQDYSGTFGEGCYIRAFDVAHSRSPSLWEAAGQTTFHLRIDGLTLGDFRYSAPGPGYPDRVAILVKVPGLTTWIDIGRRDGDGPSKQDPALDGAGCQVVGPYTFTGVDSETGVVFSQVRVHVGPVASLANGFTNTWGGLVNEVPILVKICAGEDFKNYDFTKKATNPGTFVGGADPSVWAHRVRGLTGISVLHPDSVLSPTAEELEAWEDYLDPVWGPGA